MTLAAHDVHFAYRRAVPVLRAVSAQFEPGRICVIAGPNAAGKTTLLRLLLALRRPSSGEILLNGRPVHRLTPRQRAASLAYAPQDPRVSGPFTARQVVRAGRFALPRDEPAIAESLERVGLASRADDLFLELSAGQRQRVALARALAQLRTPEQRERWLLADEPLANLDPAHARSAATILRQLAQQGVGVIAVMHDATAAARIADDALLLSSDGSVAARGPASETLTPEALASVFGLPFDSIGEGSAATLVPRWSE